MGTYPKEPINRRSTWWRNVLRGIIKRVTLVTKDDGTGLEDNIVTTATVADLAVTEAKLGAQAVSVAKCKFATTGVNLLPKKYSSFGAMEGSAPNSTDLYVVSGTFVDFFKTTTNKFLGSHSLRLRPSSGTHTIALCTGASDYPIPPVGILGTYFILSHYYMRNSTAGLTYVIQLRFSDSSTQTISGTITPTTTNQRYVSDPFTLNSPTLSFRIEIVCTSSSSIKSLFLTEQMLVCTGDSASVTEPGPWIPGAVTVADEVDNRTMRITTGRFLMPFSGNGYSGGACLDTAIVDTSGRVVTLRQTSADLNVTNILHDDGSGIEKDNALIDFKIGSGKKLTVGSQDVIDASANFAIGSGKKITVGSQDVIDASGNLAIASGKTFTVGSKQFVNSSGVLLRAAKARVLWVQQSYSASGAATEAEASVTNTSYQAIAIFAVKKYADDRTIRVSCEAKVSNGTGEIGKIEISFTNGAGSYIAESSDVTSTTYATRTASIDVTSGNPSGEELVYATVYAKCSNGKTVYVRRCVVEMLSEDV